MELAELRRRQQAEALRRKQKELEKQQLLAQEQEKIDKVAEARNKAMKSIQASNEKLVEEEKAQQSKKKKKKKTQKPENRVYMVVEDIDEVNNFQFNWEVVMRNLDITPSLLYRDKGNYRIQEVSNLTDNILNNNVANELVNTIKRMINDEINKLDTTRICQITNVHNDGTYDLYVLEGTGEENIHNIPAVGNLSLSIGDEVYIHGYIDEIRNDVIIIKNQGGYFGTVKEEIFDSLYWDLKITLQDETNYRFKGYHETPENFEAFEDFLNMLSKC